METAAVRPCLGLGVALVIIMSVISDLMSKLIINRIESGRVKGNLRRRCWDLWLRCWKLKPRWMNNSRHSGRFARRWLPNWWIWSTWKRHIHRSCNRRRNRRRRWPTRRCCPIRAGLRWLLARWPAWSRFEGRPPSCRRPSDPKKRCRCRSSAVRDPSSLPQSDPSCTADPTFEFLLT